ncbi:hypothetical protein BD779DRAFT_1569684 [Infundibulicybe gibba]|nr:hypothetical protein BD779DRAFT_1569684 [Infundibulicybe gibba]
MSNIHILLHLHFHGQERAMEFSGFWLPRLSHYLYLVFVVFPNISSPVFVVFSNFFIFLIFVVFLIFVPIPILSHITTRLPRLHRRF